jgi:integrase/recombinase XerD
MTLQQYLNQHYTTQTAKSYRREIENFITNNPKAKKYDYQSITKYIGQLRNGYSNPRTLNRIVSSIKVYYHYLAATNQRSDNPAKNILLKDKQSRDIQLQDLLTAAELEQLLNCKTERYAILATRNRVLMSLLIYQGLHARELANLRVENVNLMNATVFISATKTTNSRTLSLKANQILLMKNYIEIVREKLLGSKQSLQLLVGIRGNEFTTADITSHIKLHYKKVLETKRVNAKIIRQSVLVNLLTQQDLRWVQVFAGHKHISSTERYKQTGLDTLATAINKYHPML